MSAIFETRVARFDEADERLEILNHAIRAFEDCWAQRFEDADLLKKYAIAQYDADYPEDAKELSRFVLAELYEADIKALVQECKAHRRSLERLELFYLGEDLDPEECTKH